MSTRSSLYDLTEVYTQILEAFVAKGCTKEQLLAEAYALGRRALYEGLGVLDLVSLHHHALAELLRRGTLEKLGAAELMALGEFLGEAMSSYEIAHRGFREATEVMIRTLQFAAVLCHELRTPLTSILLSASMLEEVLDLEPGTPGAALLENIIASSTLLKGRTDDLVDIVGLQSGVLSLNVQNIDLGDLLKRICQRLEPEVIRAGLCLNLNVPECIPHIPGDPARLEQVVSNLVHNAVKYAADGGQIDVRASVFDTDVLIQVQDYGRGISVWDRMRLFVPFYRARKEQGDPPGLGVGLTLCRQVVEAHRGTISVDSETGKGTIFRITLPLSGLVRTEEEGYEGGGNRGRTRSS